MEAKKSLGQNFFINENLGNTLIEYIAKEQPERIVEIGPGLGFFTKKLSLITQNLLLIEKDNNLSEKLSLEYPFAQILNIDFLDWDFKELTNEKTIFFGSLPYNVSKPIIDRIIKSEYFKQNAYFIIQKEVAEKYTSEIPNSNFLATKTRIYADVKKLLDIGPNSFKPAPKVNSAYVRFTPKELSLDRNTLQKFEKFLENCFKSPRKTLRNNLKSYNLQDSELLNKRPQHLTLNEFLSLFTNIK